MIELPKSFRPNLLDIADIDILIELDPFLIPESPFTII